MRCRKTTRFSRRTLLAALIISSLLLAGVPAAWAAGGEVKVVTTLPDLAAIARAVGGDRVEAVALARPSEDPHYVDARPSYIVTLNRADVLIVNGLELEVGWLPNLVRRARNPAINVGGRGYLDASTAVELLQVPKGKVDRSQGDIHPGGNPHFLLDPRRGAAIARAIAARLAAVDPEHAAGYQKRGATLAAKLEALALKQRSRFARLPKARRAVVSYHASMPYLLDWLGLDEVAQIEPKPGIPPNPRHTARVLKLMKARKVGVVLQESFYPRKVGQTLSKLAGGTLVVLPGGADLSAGQSYEARIQQVADLLYRALEAAP